jgi:hypothetical protein
MRIPGPETGQPAAQSLGHSLQSRLIDIPCRVEVGAQKKREANDLRLHSQGSLKLDFLYTRKCFQGTGWGPSHCQVVWSPPTPQPPASRLPMPSALASLNQDKAQTGRGIGGGTEEWGRLHKGIPHPKPPDRQRVKKQICSPSHLLPPVFSPWLGSGHRAAAGLRRGPTHPPVGGNRITCVTGRAEPRTGGGRRQTTLERWWKAVQNREQSCAEKRCEGSGRLGATGGSWEAKTGSSTGKDGAQGFSGMPVRSLAWGFSGCSDPDPILQAPGGWWDSRRQSVQE